MNAKEQKLPLKELAVSFSARSLEKSITTKKYFRSFDFLSKSCYPLCLMDATLQENLLFSAEDLEIRLDKWLSLKFPNYSRTYFQTLIEEGAVLINGSICKKRHKPDIGDEIEVCFALTKEISLDPEPIPLDILYEDEDIIVINKKAGMVVHPAPGHPNGTFVNALLFHCKELEKELNDPLRPGIVHRLDKDTSGILVAAKNSFSHRFLVTAFSERKVKKYYQAICLGHPQNRKIEAPLARHPTKRQEMAVCEEGGKPATTLLSVLAKGPHTSSISLDLITGRTHQIRVHLKHIGSPILGDPIYGQSFANTKYGAIRQMLHAKEISIPHPKTGAILTFQAPVPTDMQKILDHLP
jgi:23S rRNA pseudouridine1911/1915/1917 synthase